MSRPRACGAWRWRSSRDCSLYCATGFSVSSPSIPYIDLVTFTDYSKVRVQQRYLYIHSLFSLLSPCICMHSERRPAKLQRRPDFNSFLRRQGRRERESRTDSTRPHYCTVAHCLDSSVQYCCMQDGRRDEGDRKELK